MQITITVNNGFKGCYTNCNVSVANSGPFEHGPFRVDNLKTDCSGQCTYECGFSDYVRFALGKWLLVGGPGNHSFMLDSSDASRAGCCPALAFGTTPAITLRNGVNFQQQSRCFFFVAASIGGVCKTAIGITATITDACGHSYTGTTLDLTGLLQQSPGNSDACSLVDRFDWSNVTTLSGVSCPDASAFVPCGFCGSTIPPPGLKDYCLCSDPINMYVDVTKYVKSGGAANATNPSNLHHVSGMYGRLAASPGGVLFWRSDHFDPAPPGWRVNQVSVTSNAADSDPHGDYDPRHQRLFCVYSNAGSAFSKFSDDDGETWTVGGTVAGGAFPRLAYDPLTGNALVAGYVGGVITGKFQGQGELTSSAAFNFVDTHAIDIPVENDSFDIQGFGDTWYGIWRVLGSGTCSFWRSDDGALSWKKQFDCFSGCARPRLTIRHGHLIVAALSGTTIKTAFKGSGDLLLGTEVSAMTGVTADTFDISYTIDGAKVIGVWTVTGETAPSEWRSGDDAASFKRVN